MPIIYPLYLLGGILLFVASIMSWHVFPVLGLEIGVPGLLWHGSWLAVCGMMLTTIALFRLRVPGVVLLIILSCAFATGWDVHTILKRGDYSMEALQLKIAPINHALASLNMEEIQLYKRAASPWERVGRGPSWALGALVLLSIGLGFEFSTEARGDTRTVAGWIGRPTCRSCGCRVKRGMRFCPGCGANFLNIKVCRACQQVLKPSYHFCFRCGQEAPC